MLLFSVKKSAPRLLNKIELSSAYFGFILGLRMQHLPSLVFYFTTYPKHDVGNAEKGFVVQLYDRNVTLFGNKLHVYLGNPSQERETYGNLCIV